MQLAHNRRLGGGIGRALAQAALARGDIVFGMVGAVEKTGLAQARAVMETNFFGLLQVTHAVLPSFRAQRSGHIVNVSSGVGLVVMPGMPIYSASKHAVEGLSEALAGEAGH